MTKIILYIYFILKDSWERERNIDFNNNISYHIPHEVSGAVIYYSIYFDCSYFVN